MTVSPGGPAILLLDGRDWQGAPLDVLIVAEHVAAVGEQVAAHPASASARPVSLAGRTLLPAAAEPHAHLDKSLLGGRAPNRTGTLAGALQAMSGAAGLMTGDEILSRARRAADVALRRGFTAIRSHVDVGGSQGIRGMEALVQLRHEQAELMDLQLVALMTGSLAGENGRLLRRQLRAVLDRGCDVIGGAPWLAADPGRAIDELTAAAADSGAAIDLHLDETTDASSLAIVRYLERVEQLGLGGRATASHCVSLGQQGQGRARELAAALAGAGVAVVVLPQTNLGLQGRGQATRVPRALPPIALLEQAGTLVAAGGDNWRDPFNPAGRIDPMETATLLATAGHLSPVLAYDMVSARARAVLGLPPALLRAGDMADLIAIVADDLTDAVAGGSEDRMIWHRGRLVASTTVSSVAGADLPLPAQ